jgi:hypothetical protein
MVTMKVQGRELKLEIDSGAKNVNILSLETLKNLNVDANVSNSKVLIAGVHGKPLKAYGKVTLPCMYKGVSQKVEFQILDDDCKKVDILGRNDSIKFGLIKRVHAAMALSNDQLIKEYKDVFSEVIGLIPGEYEIKIDQSIQPVIHPPRPVPAPIRQQVKEELEKMERGGIIAKVTEPTPWVSPTVYARKPNGRIRVCMDPSRTLNLAIQREHFPMASIEDIVTRLSGSTFYTVCDAMSGFYQVKLTEESSKLTTFNTPFGRFRHIRMPMGISSAPEIFQRAMNDMFGDLPGVEILMDDILVHAPTLDEHNRRLERVLRRAREKNLKFNPKKLKCAVQEVDYVGHRLTKDGVKPTAERIKAITELKEPENFAELETVLGMVSYVAKFIPNLSEINAPLRELKKAEDWKWDEKHSKAYQKIKDALTKTPVLKYYDVDKAVLISVDASSKGLGAAVIQDNGVVAYASRALSETEQRYAQIEK